MKPRVKSSRKKKVLVAIAVFLILFVLFLGFFANRLVEPILRDRLHTLIIQGSDSLYQYSLGGLNANFFGGSVEVENLQIHVDDKRYQLMSAQHTLPALTLELNLVKGRIRGLAVLPLLFGKKIDIHEIYSKDADVVLLRHVHKDDVPENTQPLWKSIQPVIKSISINKINLDGIKLLYKNADTSRSVKLQFDKCVALFNDIKIDSAAAADTARIAFIKEFAMQFYDLKFRTADSTYKLKAELISYASKTKVFEVTEFKIQPTLKEKEDFYKAAQRSESMYVFSFKKARFTNLLLDQFFHRNMLVADTLFIDQPELSVYKDATFPPLFESKIGAFPHQRLLQANATVMLKGMVVKGADIAYTERGEKSGEEGSIRFTDLDLQATNITNDSNRIKQNAKCVLVANGKIFNSSPLNIKIDFYLDSVNGRFDASGNVDNVTAAQLNVVSKPLANTTLQSFNMQHLGFAVQGNDYGAVSNVQMRYNSLFVILQKQDDETGAMSTKKFLTKILNKFTLHQSNPGANGIERQAVGIKRARITSQSFFGLLWKSIFGGMQDVMMQSGRFE
jgi:hypothetical protein